MNVSRLLVVLAALLLGGLNLASGADKVLVPGDPPLTQTLLEKRLRFLEWLLDARFTDKQRTDYQSLFMQAWKNAKPAQQRHWDQCMTADAERLDKMGREERVRQQQAAILRLLPVYEKSTYPGERWIAEQYHELYKPGGPNNPILVAGDPPLTQRLADLDTAFVELLLDLRLPAEQRKEYRALLVENWKESGADERRRRTKDLEKLTQLPAWSNYRRAEVRALNLANTRAEWAKDQTKRGRWLVALDEESCRPASARNPVLVDSEPPLTQLVVDRYRDFLEFMIDLSVSGGFSIQEREILQDFLVKGWKKRTADARKDLLADLKRWSEEAGRGTAAADKCISAMRPRLLAELRVARDDPLSLWLLEVRNRETELHQQNLALEKRRDEMALDSIRAIPTGPTGHWEYNSRIRSYEWVQDK
jgi:hypothetical protein